MKVISKKIALNTFPSKLPGVVSSIMNSWIIPPLYNCGKIDGSGETFFSYDSAVKRASEYNINPSQLVHKSQFIQFDKNNLIEFKVGNYGLIPSDVIIPIDIAENVTDYTDFYVNLPVTDDFLETLDDEEKKLYNEFFDLTWPINKERDPHYEGRNIISGDTEIKILTYSTLNKWYSFFKKYYNLIHNPSSARIYETAIDYYNKEVSVKNEELLNYYQSLDDTFVSRGGKDMYNWISNNCIIQYQIPEKFVDGWNTTYLYYPDAIKWYHWFKERSENYENVSILEDCAIVDLKDGNCCDCTEFVKLGGHEFYEGLKEWVDNVEIDNSSFTNAASITIPISISTSIDDLGEMTIFSNKWKDEEDYHNTLNDNGFGTVVDRPHIKYCKCNECGYSASENEFENGCPKCGSNSFTPFDATLYDVYMIKPGEERKGYEYNRYYENAFKWNENDESECIDGVFKNEDNETDWVNYTDYYMCTHPEEFITQNENSEQVTAFTYSPINGKVIYNPTDDDLIKDIKINEIPNVCINGITYNVIDGKYVELCYPESITANIKYRKNIKLQIFKDGDIEYTVLNGKRKYVETDPEDPSKEMIYFFKESNCKDEGCKVDEGKYVIYDNYLYLVDDNKITIEEDETKKIYPVLDGYFDIGGSRFYISGDSIVVQDKCEYESETYTFKFKEISEEELVLFGVTRIIISDDKTNVKLYYDYTIIPFDVVSGYTDSKLSILRRKEITTDDLGNELPGYFKSIVDITKGEGQSKYNLPYDECTLDILYKVGEVSGLKQIDYEENKFIGNIITDIKFYYADDNRTPIEETVKHALEDDALKAIEDCENAFIELDDDTIPDIMYCDITYYIGCVINKQNDENSGGKYTLNETLHKGVKYVDTVYVSKKVGTYYLNDDKYFTFKYYLLSQGINTISITDFNTNTVWDASTYFEFEPMIYTKEGLYHEEEFNGFEKNNGIVSSPLIRTEFNLSSSMPQNVDADIYIDRGINAAFEKLLKLQEFRTMEALENYGNGWFKINKY